MKKKKKKKEEFYIGKTDEEKNFFLIFILKINQNVGRYLEMMTMMMKTNQTEQKNCNFRLNISNYYRLSLRIFYFEGNVYVRLNYSTNVESKTAKV